MSESGPARGQWVAYSVEVTILDNSLDIAETKPLVDEWVGRQLGHVRVDASWGGPAAGGLVVDVAVSILVPWILNNIGSDAYKFLKSWIKSVYPKIRLENAARLYHGSAFSIGLMSDNQLVDITFIFPGGLDGSSLDERLAIFERDAPGIMQRWEEARPDGVSAYLQWDETSEEWIRVDDFDEIYRVDDPPETSI